MDIFDNIYNRSISENQRNLIFWENYLKSLKELDFKVYSEKLKVPVLVPAGNRILFRGELKHTNEVTVALGANYFVKCSVTQAEILRQHRIKDAESKLSGLRKEHKYLDQHLNFTKSQIFESSGKEIVEPFNEEEDKAWRQKHKENMRKYKQKKEPPKQQSNVTDEELWDRLEELELQEELENEMEKMDTKQSTEVAQVIPQKEPNDNFMYNPEATTVQPFIKEKQFVATESINQSTHNRDLLQKVLDKQCELEQKLTDLKNRDKTETKTEKDILSRLEDLEELDELEDELDRLDDVLQKEETEEPTPLKSKHGISFADDNDAETLEIEFTHSNRQPNEDPYDPNKGIRKPSDVYQAFSYVTEKKPRSILKKSKYESKAGMKAVKFNDKPNGTDDKVIIRKVVHDVEPQEHKPIIIKDVVEKDLGGDSKVENVGRPPSLFKMKRMQKK